MERSEALLDQAARVCDRQGARLTELRRRVLELILRADGPATAYQLLDQLKETRKGAAPPTVYRALDFLLDQKLIHKVERLGAFVPCVEAGHDHVDGAQFLICRGCGAVLEIEDAGVSAALRAAAARAGFRLDAAMVELDGLCAPCAAAGTPPDSRQRSAP